MRGDSPFSYDVLNGADAKHFLMNLRLPLEDGSVDMLREVYIRGEAIAIEKLTEPQAFSVFEMIIWADGWEH